MQREEFDFIGFIMRWDMHDVPTSPVFVPPSEV
jgi:hypothetical protein